MLAPSVGWGCTQNPWNHTLLLPGAAPGAWDGAGFPGSMTPKFPAPLSPGCSQLRENPGNPNRGNPSPIPAVPLPLKPSRSRGRGGSAGIGMDANIGIIPGIAEPRDLGRSQHSRSQGLSPHSSMDPGWFPASGSLPGRMSPLAPEGCPGALPWILWESRAGGEPREPSCSWHFPGAERRHHFLIYF